MERPARQFGDSERYQKICESGPGLANPRVEVTFHCDQRLSSHGFTFTEWQLKNTVFFTGDVVHKDEHEYKQLPFMRRLHSRTRKTVTAFAIFVDEVTHRCHRLTTQEGTTLFVGESDGATSALAVDAIGSLEDPDEGQYGEGERGPVDEAADIRY